MHVTTAGALQYCLNHGEDRLGDDTCLQGFKHSLGSCRRGRGGTCSPSKASPADAGREGWNSRFLNSLTLSASNAYFIKDVLGTQRNTRGTVSELT